MVGNFHISFIRDAFFVLTLSLSISSAEEKRPNAPTYAVLDSQPGKWEMDGKGTNNVRNHALLHYLATLANSNNRDDVFNFEFVESLVRSGADINCMDTNGQTIFHEVARSWNVDVALFLVENGWYSFLSIRVYQRDQDKVH